VDRGWTIFVRCAGVSAALALLGVGVSDFYTDFWVEHAMFTAVLSVLLVATVLGAIVDTYLERRDLRRWATVAAIATGEFAFVARWVRRLNDFVALTGRVWKLADELSKEQLEHRAIPLGEDWVAGRIAKLIELAARLEVDFNLAVRDLTPLEDWMGAPEWFRPPREREIAPAG